MYGNIKNLQISILRKQPGRFKKTHPLNYFLAVQPIFNSLIPINSAQLVKECDNIKKVPNFILGEQPGKFNVKLPSTLTLTPFNPLLLTVYRLSQLDN
jgi:hypothetical protein